MHDPIAAIEAVSGARPPAVAPMPAMPNAQPDRPDPAALSAFRQGLAASEPAAAAPRPHSAVFVGTVSPGSEAPGSAAFMRWAEQAQQDFSSAMATPNKVPGDFAEVFKDMHRVALTCVAMTLCKNVADQLVQAGQTLLRQQN